MAKIKTPDASDLFSDLSIPEPAESEAAPAPTAKSWQTDATHFFGFERQAPDESTPTAEALADYRPDASYDVYTKAFVRGKALWLLGPTGSGKTTYAQWLSQQTGLPFLKIDHHPEWMPEEVMGRPVQDASGKWIYEEGELTNRFGQGGFVFLDELAAIKASLSQFYHPFVADKHVWIRRNGRATRIDRHPRYRIAAASNPWHTYHGNHEPGIALLDRVLIVPFDYMSTDNEVAMLSERAPSVAEGLIRDLVAFANQWRQAAMASPDTFRLPMSTRALMNTVDLMHDIELNVDDAIKLAIIEPARIKAPAELDTLTNMMRAHIDLRL